MHEETDDGIVRFIIPLNRSVNIQVKDLVNQQINIAGGTDVYGPSGCQL